jgi:hypothetical protein
MSFRPVVVASQRRDVRNDRKWGISMVDSSLRCSVSGLPMITSGAPFWVGNSPSAAAKLDGW